MAKKQQPKIIVPNSPKIQDIDIHGYYHCVYEFFTDCEINRCDEICRCGKILNAKIDAEEIEIERILNSVIRACRQFIPKDYKLTYIDEYCLERILVHHKMYDTEQWYIKIRDGYYSEEIDGIVSQNEVNLNKDLINFWSCQSNKEKIEFVLLLEYEIILPSIKNAIDYKVVIVNKEQIYAPSRNYNKKVQVIEVYKNRKLPHAICFEKNDVYDIIDGYHRVKSFDGNKLKVIVAEF